MLAPTPDSDLIAPDLVHISYKICPRFFVRYDFDYLSAGKLFGPINIKIISLFLFTHTKASVTF